MTSIRHVEFELHIRVRRLKWTKRARGGRVRVGEVATCKSDIGVHVGAATHPRRWVNHHELSGRAGDQLVAECWVTYLSACRSVKQVRWKAHLGQ